MTASHSRGAVLCETGERRTHRMRKALFRFARWNEVVPSISCEAGGSGPRDCRQDDADHQSIDPQAARHAAREEKSACAAAEPAEARRMHARVHDDAEEAELGP